MDFVKYPRTPHLPWSLGITSDDKIIKSLDNFIGKRVVITEKMDGENYSIYRNGCHARSLESANRTYRDWINAFQANIGYKIPNGMRLCGEYLYAKHSIKYDNLKSYFLCFSMWDNNICISWDNTVYIANEFGVEMVPVIYDGIFDESLIKDISLDINVSEGYVVRLAESFSMDLFKLSVAKYVRENHVVNDSHWRNSKLEVNKLEIK